MNLVNTALLWFISLFISAIPQGGYYSGTALRGITAGDLITCEASWNWNASITSVADSLNGTLTSLHSGSDSTLQRGILIYYVGNSAAGNSDVITFTYTPTETHGAMSCQAWKNAKTTSQFYDSGTNNPNDTGATGTNASSGNYTTNTNGDLNIGLLLTNSVTPTANSGMLVDTISAESHYPQYFIQATASATTTMVYTNTSIAWRMIWGAFQNNGGTLALDGACHSTADNGGSTATTVVVTISC